MEKKDIQRQTFGTREPEVRDYRPRVVVKFHDYVELPYVDGVEEYIQERQIESWARLVEEFPDITFRRFYAALDPKEIQALVDQATELDRTYHPPNLLAYFAIDCPPSSDPQPLAEALSAWETVQAAYVESRPASAVPMRYS